MSTTYTIDLALREESWTWRLYTRGGTVFLLGGEAGSIEQASSDARTALIVAHRKDDGS